MKMINKDNLDLILRKGNKDDLPDFAVMRLAINDLGGTIVKMKDDKVFVDVNDVSEINTDPEVRATIKRLLWDNWQFKFLWRVKSKSK